jgi:hypothetical protein
MVFPWVALPLFHAICRKYRPSFLQETGRPDLRKTLLAATIVAILLSLSAPLGWLGWNEVPDGRKRVKDWTPVQVSRYLRTEYDPHPEYKPCIFTSETLGDYLLWDLRPKRPVRIFVYTHVHLLTPKHWQTYQQMRFGDPGWEKLMDDFQVQFVVLEYELYHQHPGGTGISNLINRIQADPAHWEVIKGKDFEQAIFVARRKSTDQPRAAVQHLR